MDIEIGGAPASSLPNGYHRRQLGAAISARYQELIILPTEKCNFRCTYCYEDFAIGKMTKTTQRAIELLIDRRITGLSRLALSWFGGEPLLAKDVVLRLARHAHQACEALGVAFEGGMTTNGYLLDRATFDQLLACNQNFFQITLDGWEAHHDSHRRRADGQGTFARIWSNLLSMKRSDNLFEVVVRVHVRRDNFGSVDTLMDRYAEHFHGDPRFRLDFQNLRDLGGEGGKTITDPIGSEEATALLDRFLARVQATHRSTQAAQVSAQTASAGAETTRRPMGESAGSRRSSELSQNEPYICYAARPNSILIRANGRIGKCTVAFSDPRNDLGYLGDEGTLHINNAKLQPWIRGLGSLDNHETACPLDGLPASHLESPVPGRKVVPIVAAS